MSYIWPLVLMIVSNTVYHVCAKSLPTKLDPLASLTVSYFFAAISSGILYFVVNRGSADLLREYSGMNWVPFLLGLVLVGMEAGSIYAYRAGWSVSTLQVTSAAGIAALLVFVGYLAYHEAITPASSSALPAASWGFISSTNELCRAHARGMIEENAERKRNVEL